MTKVVNGYEVKPGADLRGADLIDATGLESVVITSGATTAGQVNKKYIIDNVPGHIVTLPAVSNPGDIMAVEARNCHVFIEQKDADLSGAILDKKEGDTGA